MNFSPYSRQSLIYNTTASTNSLHLSGEFGRAPWVQYYNSIGVILMFDKCPSLGIFRAARQGHAAHAGHPAAESLDRGISLAA